MACAGLPFNEGSEDNAPEGMLTAGARASQRAALTMSKLTQCHPNAWRRSLTNCALRTEPDRSARAHPSLSCSPSRSRSSGGHATRRGCRWVGASAQTPSIAEPSAESGLEVEMTVGIETHVQLRTKTKAFCSCPNEYGGDVNSHVCPVSDERGAESKRSGCPLLERQTRALFVEVLWNPCDDVL